jgi:hypothetical protein
MSLSLHKWLPWIADLFCRPCLSPCTGPRGPTKNITHPPSPPSPRFRSPPPASTLFPVHCFSLIVNLTFTHTHTYTHTYTKHTRNTNPGNMHNTQHTHTQHVCVCVCVCVYPRSFLPEAQIANTTQSTLQMMFTQTLSTLI